MHAYQVAGKKKVHLDEIDPGDTAQFKGDKKEGLEKLAELNRQLDALQEVFYAERKNRLLVVLQAMDTAGKDGTVRSVFDGVNPQGVRVVSFKTPTAEELDHDYLWRVHQQTPVRGEIVIFNRSHYEDILIVRVHELVPEKVWRKRFHQINQFEKILVEEGTTILKFFLHIDPEEQRQRLLERIQDPTKQWKFNPNDLKERELWPAYMQAYEDVLNKTSTPWAPWYVIPANRNWYRNLMVSSILVDTLQKIKPAYPSPAGRIESYISQLNPGGQTEQE